MAQNIEEIGKKESFKVGGGINANQVLYMSDRQNANRAPYNYFINGNLNLAYAGISAPLSFSYSNQKFSYGQPFNILGISPKYKWVTAHLGWRNMSFSPYTLNGHSFLGAGVEVEPKKGWKSAVMYGRMLKAVEMDPSGTVRPSYERFGMGFKTEYSNSKGTIGISMFKAKDYKNSLETPLDTINILPQENLAIGLKLLRRLDHWTIGVDMARSALTRDTRSPLSEKMVVGVNSLYFIPRHTTTDFYNAYKANVNYQFKSFNVGVGYERIDPGYRTLGAYFFNNDLESYTVNFATSLFKNKVSFNTNLGLQKDNLNNKKLSTMKRVVSSFNLNYTPSQKLNLSLSYSNFQSFTNVRSQIRPVNATNQSNIDTLSFIMISQSAQATAMYAIKSTETVSSAVMLSGSAQFASQRNSKETFYNPTFYNGNLGYSHGLPKKKISANLGINANISGDAQTKTIFIGPNAGISKTIFKDKVRSGITASWNTVLLNGISTSAVFNLGLNSSYSINKHNNINLSTTYLHLAKPKVGDVVGYTRAINEVTINLGYGYSF